MQLAGDSALREESIPKKGVVHMMSYEGYDELSFAISSGRVGLDLHFQCCKGRQRVYQLR